MSFSGDAHTPPVAGRADGTVRLHHREGEAAPHPHRRKGETGARWLLTLVAQVIGVLSVLYAAASCGARTIGYSGLNATDKLARVEQRLDATDERVDSLIVTRLADGREQRAEVARLNRWVVGAIKMQCLKAGQAERVSARLMEIPCDSLVGELGRRTR